MPDCANILDMDLPGTDLAEEIAPFEVRGTLYGRAMVAMRMFKVAGLAFVVVGEVPALLVGRLPGAWQLLAWAWAIGSVWLVARWARRRTRVWSVVSPDGIVVHCHRHESHLAWSDIRGFEVMRLWAYPVYLCVHLHDGGCIQIAATAGRSAEVIEHIVTYGQWATDGAWTPESIA